MIQLSRNIEFCQRLTDEKIIPLISEWAKPWICFLIWLCELPSTTTSGPAGWDGPPSKLVADRSAAAAALLENRETMRSFQLPLKPLELLALTHTILLLSIRPSVGRQHS